MTVSYAVTFEFPERAPETHRGTVESSQPATCVSRATKNAQKVLRPKGWSSVAVILLERLS